VGCAWPGSAQDGLRSPGNDKDKSKQQPMPSSTATTRERPLFVHKAGKVIGADVYRHENAMGVDREGDDPTKDDKKGEDTGGREKIGEVKDLLIANDGSVGFAILSLKDYGDKRFAMPFAVLQPTFDEGKLDSAEFFVSLDDERLKRAPSFDEDHWPDLASYDGLRPIDEFYRDAARNAGVREGTWREEASSMPAGARAEKPMFLRGSKVRGCQVSTSSGDNAGEVEEIAVDGKNGAIAFAVLSTGGFLGLGEDHHAVPWRALTFTIEDNDKDFEDRDVKCRLNIPESKLENAPKYEKEDWKKVNDPLYVEKLYTYYGYPAYWDPNSKPLPEDHDESAPKHDDKDDKDGR
jgi:sporulation protein YlmC with PRC-barrel domain